MTRPLLVAALIVVSGGVAFAGPTPPPQPGPVPRLAHDLPRLREWIDAVDRHIPGQPDGAAISVGSWSRAELEALFFDLKALIQLITTAAPPRSPRAMRAFTSPELEELQDLAVQQARRVADHPARPPQLTGSDARRIVNRLVKRATLLHTDIALLVPAAADRDAGSSVPRLLIDLRSSVVVVDGRQVGVTYYGAHWDFARLLLGEVTPDPAHDLTVRQWYRSVATLFASRYQWSEADAHLARARKLFPADPEIIAASGRLHETYASPRIQQFLDTSAPTGDRTAAIGSSRSNLRQAETFFDKAIELDGSLTGARLHRGRVRGLEGHHEDAANELRRVAVTAGDSPTQYYAWLFLGAEEQSLGRLDRARESFEKAAALYPRAQSPYLALSQLARRRGDRLGALRSIQQVLALSINDREHEDPWSTYLPGNAAQARMLLSELRAALFLTPQER